MRMFLNEHKCLTNGGEHSQREAVDFENPESIEIIFVPFDNRSSRHGGIFDRHQFTEWATGHHHSANVLRKMARKAA